MDKRSKIFFIILLGLVLVSLVLTAYRTLLTKNFEVIESEVVEEEN
ncbi:MAG TPA: hypothetical protein VGA06_02420 [Candidatus Paceibacterota bacterium]|jgi:hypothetical protein